MRRAVFSLILLGVLTACTTGRTGPGTSTAPLVYDPAERPQRMAYALKFIEAMKSDEEIRQDIVREYDNPQPSLPLPVSEVNKKSGEALKQLAKLIMLPEQLKHLPEIKEGYAVGYAETLRGDELKQLADIANYAVVKRAWLGQVLSTEDQAELVKLGFPRLQARLIEVAPEARRIMQAHNEPLNNRILVDFFKKVGELRQQGQLI